MASTTALTHEGESTVKSLMRVPNNSTPTSPFLTPNGAHLLSSAPLLALGTLDVHGRPWTTLLGSGDAALAANLAPSLVGVRARVDRQYDPVVEALLEGRDEMGVVRVQQEGEGVRKVGGLTIDLEARKRVKLAGRLVVGALPPEGGEDEDVQLVIKIDESLGNCPKYLNSKHIVDAEAKPVLISDSSQLPDEALALLNKADTIFVTSSHKHKTFDTNIRGGPAGFMRVVSNDKDGAVVVWPEYSGNRLYQTLGNFITTPEVGIVVPDFETGDVLYFTGTTQVLVGKEATSILPRSNLAVTVKILSARYVQNGLPFRGHAGSPSPYNPTVRYASTEKLAPGTAAPAVAGTSITLISQTKLTPSISRFRFRLPSDAVLPPWKPGQYASISFADELDVGYSHMRDDDPLSLNDDFVRTFTVSSPPSAESTARGRADAEFDLTIRNVGRVTNHLFKAHPRAGLQCELKGFEGEFAFDMGGANKMVPVIAGGIGVTPVLGQLKDIDVSRLRLLWTMGVQDVGMVADTFEQYPGLRGVTTVFVTGTQRGEKGEEKYVRLVDELESSGARVERRRMAQEDIEAVGKEPGVEEYYMCVGPALKTSVLAWLAGKRVVFEDFNY